MAATMRPAPPVEPTAIQSPFDAIYQAAKEKNEEKLTRALSSTCIDLLHTGEKVYMTPITMLAAEGDKKSVDFLISFGALLIGAAMGYAEAGESTEVDFLLDKIKREHPGQLVWTLQKTAFSFVIGGHSSKAYKLLAEIKKGAYPGHQISRVLMNMASGFAHIGDRSGIDELLAIAKSQSLLSPDQITAIWYQVGFSFVRGGYGAQAEKLLNELKQEQRCPMLHGIATAFARNGDAEKAYQFLEKIEKEYPTHIAITLACMASEFITGGHGKKADSLFLNKIKEDQVRLALICIIENSAQSGYTAQAYRYVGIMCKRYDTNYASAGFYHITIGFAKGRHKKAIDEFLKEYEALEDHPYLLFGLRGLAVGFAQSGDNTEIYNLLDMINRKYSHKIRLSGILKHIARGFAQSGNSIEADEFLRRIKEKHFAYITLAMLDNIALGFVEGGFPRHAYKLLDEVKGEARTSMLKCIASAEKTSGKCIDKSVVLKTLTMIEDTGLRMRVVGDLKESVPTAAYDLERLVPKAAKLTEVMKSQGFNYGQVLGWIDPGIRMLLWDVVALLNNPKGASPFRKVDVNMMMLVLSFLSPMTLIEARHVSNRIAAQYPRRTPFFFITPPRRLLGEQSEDKPEEALTATPAKLN